MLEQGLKLRKELEQSARVKHGFRQTGKRNISKTYSIIISTNTYQETRDFAIDSNGRTISISYAEEDENEPPLISRHSWILAESPLQTR